MGAGFDDAFNSEAELAWPHRQPLHLYASIAKIADLPGIKPCSVFRRHRPIPQVADSRAGEI